MTRAVIAGVGEAPLTPQGSGRAAETMAIEAALAACRDAGVDASAVDGIVKYTYDGAISTMMLGATLGAHEMRAFVEIPSGGGSSVALVDVARALVLSGRARAVLCLRTLLGA